MCRLFNFLLLVLLLAGCSGSQTAQSALDANAQISPPQQQLAVDRSVQITPYPTPGAEDLEVYLPMLAGKSIGLVVNKASQVDGKHLVDVLMSNEVNVTAIFAPEHGFRGDADAGEHIDSQRDMKTNLPIYSLYGKTKKPSSDVLSQLDVIVFDLQDVGVRFYTYLSTLHYVMEAAAEQGKQVIILDRPNPNGYYIAGPVLDKELTSFVGLHPVPIVTGMTIGEYGLMINGQGWLANGIKCNLKVIKCPTYTHQMTFELPVSPSPNLPNHRAVLLYPSLCLFEGTTVSVGRGTDAPFQQIGHPQLDQYTESFRPVSGYGSKSPKHQDQYCYGKNFQSLPLQEIIDQRLDFTSLIEFHQALSQNGIQFYNKNNFFEKLAGTSTLREALGSGLSNKDLQLSWSEQLSQFKSIRQLYLLYP